MIRVKGSERRPFFFVPRLNIVEHDSYQADKIVMVIEEWKLKVSCGMIMSKALVKFY